MDYFTDLYMFWQKAIERTFIVDNRYQIFLDGIKNTLTITVGALCVGVLIGVAVAISKVYYYQVGPYTIMGSLKLFFKEKRIEFLGRILLRLWDGFLNIYLTLFRGTPVVVQLMIWAFVVFATADGIFVAIIGFGVRRCV